MHHKGVYGKPTYKLKSSGIQMANSQIAFKFPWVSGVKSSKKMAEAVFKGRRTAICVHHSANGHYAGPDDMSRFINILRSDSYRAGFFFSSTQFKDICHNIVREKVSIPVKPKWASPTTQ